MNPSRPEPPWPPARHRRGTSYEEPPPPAAIQAAIALQETCACGHSRLAHLYKGCVSCLPPRHCGGYQERRSSKLRAAAAYLRAALTALRERP